MAPKVKVLQCTNGHVLAVGQNFCPQCGAPLYIAPPPVKNEDLKLAIEELPDQIGAAIAKAMAAQNKPASDTSKKPIRVKGGPRRPPASAYRKPAPKTPAAPTAPEDDEDDVPEPPDNAEDFYFLWQKNKPSKRMNKLEVFEAVAGGYNGKVNVNGEGWVALEDAGFAPKAKIVMSAPKATDTQEHDRVVVPAPPAAPEPPKPEDFYVFANGQKFGPLTRERALTWVNVPDTQFWRTSDPNWKSAIAQGLTPTTSATTTTTTTTTTNMNPLQKLWEGLKGNKVE